ncbi:MAG: hypothetical protein M5R42_19670, partial [Rhodocyclaceae bacterium]|nr:hypothetical protein [Rhodocyclaceae bacterium]
LIVIANLETGDKTQLFRVVSRAGTQTDASSAPLDARRSPHVAGRSMKMPPAGQVAADSHALGLPRGSGMEAGF